MMYKLTVPQFTKTLRNLLAILEKGARHADAKKFEMDVLLQSRLAPDQFNLIRQVQIACDTAKLCVSRLTTKEAPNHTDTEQHLPELQSRIQSVIAFLETIKPGDFQGAETRQITTPRWDGQHLLGEEFLIEHSIPNFYFHVTTAYAILRHNGVDVGKKDYLGKMPFRK